MIEFIVKFLINKKGYLKKHPKFLAEKFGCTELEAREALNLVKGNRVPQRAEVLVDTLKEPLKERSVPIKDSFRNNPGVYWITGCAHAPWHNKAMYESTFNFLDKEINLTGLILG